MDVVLGIDIGTTGCKALLIGAEGQILGRGYQGYPLHTLPGGVVEQDPNDWYAGMCAAVKQAIQQTEATPASPNPAPENEPRPHPASPFQIRALSLSTQGASSCIVDRSGKELTSAISWMDTRATPQTMQLAARIDPQQVYEKTGWPIAPSLDLAKLLWIHEHHPDWLAEGNRFISTLEYVNHRLTGIWAIDPTNAAMRQMLNIRTRQWDPELLTLAGVVEDQLTPVLPTGAELGGLTREAAADLGLPEGTLVFNGAHDQYCGMLGCGVRNPGELMLSTGTAWVLLAVTDQPFYSASFLAPGPHVFPNQYGVLAALSTAGASFDWMRNKLTGLDYRQIDAQAGSRRQKNEHSFFFPYLAGTEFPLWQNQARGTFTGLDLDTDAIDLALICMEGSAFHWRMAIDEYLACQIPIRQIRVTGGAANSPVWLSILANLSPCEIVLMSVKDAPAVGAALIAGVGCGLFSDWQTPLEQGGLQTEILQTTPEDQAFYEKKYQTFCRQWQTIQNI